MCLVASVESGGCVTPRWGCDVCVCSVVVRYIKLIVDASGICWAVFFFLTAVQQLTMLFQCTLTN